MKTLNNEEIKVFADTLAFTEEQARDITDLFMELSYSWQVNSPLNCVEDYIYVWECRWHREENAKTFYEYEKENCFYDYDDESVFESVETFIDFACVEQQFAFKLKHSDMIIVVY